MNTQDSDPSCGYQQSSEVESGRIGHWDVLQTENSNKFVGRDARGPNIESDSHLSKDACAHLG